MDFETPPGSRPTLNSYLLWIAKNRDVRRRASGAGAILPDDQ